MKNWLIMLFAVFWPTALSSQTGNSLCSFRGQEKEIKVAEYQSLQKVLIEAKSWLSDWHPTALNDFIRPYMMPPLQMNCEDIWVAKKQLSDFRDSIISLKSFIQTQPLKQFKTQ